MVLEWVAVTLTLPPACTRSPLPITAWVWLSTTATAATGVAAMPPSAPASASVWTR